MTELTHTASPAVESLASLETVFGDPWDGDNPLGFSAILAADERGDPFEAGEKALDGYGLNADVVPVALGGRFRRMDHYIDLMRMVFRRDPALGLGYGIASFIASVNVWTAGDPPQRRRLANLLLSNGKVAAAYHELAHGNDLTRVECSAVPDDGTWRLFGRKEVVTNLQRADALVVFARTSSARSGRSHSQFFLPKAELDLRQLRYLPRVPTSGMRGVQLGGAEFDGLVAPADSMLGAPGDGLAIALSSFHRQTARTCSRAKRPYGPLVGTRPPCRASVQTSRRGRNTRRNHGAS